LDVFRRLIVRAEELVVGIRILESSGLIGK